MASDSLLSSLSLLCLLTLFSLVSSDDNPFTYIVCPTDSNFTTNSTYQSNLDHLLSTLPSAGSLTGFNFSTKGHSPNKVYGRVICRADLPSSTCQSCITTAVEGIKSKCPFGKRAIIFYDKCFVRYSDTNTTSQEEKDWLYILYNVNDISDSVVQNFEDLYTELMGNLISQAANSSRMSGFGQANYTNSSTMYGLAECMRDQSPEECYTCLQESLGRFRNCCTGRQGGVVLRYECYVRTEIYPYFVSTLINAPPPPPPSLSPPVLMPPPPASIVPSSTSIKYKRKFLPLVLGPLLCSMFVIFIVFVLIMLRRRRATKPANKKDETREASPSLLFKLKDLRLATIDFCDAYKLGQGGFGSVYKGFLPNGQEIAVKRLSIGSGQGLSELKNEVIILAQLQHKNLVKLLGFCLENTEKILVYEFLPNTSLDKFLSDNEKCEQLNWRKRYEIIKGIARGILYLHEESRIMIIHRDLKTSNILLDETLLPKISDFGLAKLFDLDKSIGTASRIVGTNGYIAPECFMQNYISTKSDVFSYGVIVLEILSGKSVRDFQGSGSAPNLLSFVWKKWREGEALNIIDQRLHGVYKVNEVLQCINIALLCVQRDPSKRPNMATIVLMLNSYSTSLAAPSIPAFFVDENNTIAVDYARDSRANGPNRRKSNQPSTNNVTITEMDPR
ncbi:hypothetical protein LUZ60_001363 [Juncus effusus]|nr:hypothetical protein LUZ60_001363 [Juncus effusus]